MVVLGGSVVGEGGRVGGVLLPEFFFNKKHILGLKITDFIEAEK